jgi:hypothetical protein
MLRASGFLGSLKSEEPVLASVLSPFLADRTRLLIGGSADIATLCAVGRIAGARKPDISVMDRCAAPLKLIDEFAAARGVPCRTIHADLLECDGAEKWDVILLNYTLVFIDPHLRTRFFERLALSLAPKGVLVCLTKTGIPDRARESEALEAAWFTQAYDAVCKSPLAAPWQRAELERLLHRYARGRTARRLNLAPIEAIRKHLRDAGLSLLSETATSRRWGLKAGILPTADIESSMIVVARREN